MISVLLTAVAVSCVAIGYFKTKDSGQLKIPTTELLMVVGTPGAGKTRWAVRLAIETISRWEEVPFKGALGEDRVWREAGLVYRVRSGKLQKSRVLITNALLNHTRVLELFDVVPEQIITCATFIKPDVATIRHDADGVMGSLSIAEKYAGAVLLIDEAQNTFPPGRPLPEGVVEVLSRHRHLSMLVLMTCPTRTADGLNAAVRQRTRAVHVCHDKTKTSPIGPLPGPPMLAVAVFATPESKQRIGFYVNRAHPWVLLYDSQGGTTGDEVRVDDHLEVTGSVRRHKAGFASVIGVAAGFCAYWFGPGLWAARKVMGTVNAHKAPQPEAEKRLPLASKAVLEDFFAPTPQRAETQVVSERKWSLVRHLPNGQVCAMLPDGSIVSGTEIQLDMWAAQAAALPEEDKEEEMLEALSRALAGS